MTKVTINGKEVTLSMNWLTLRNFAEVMGYKNPTEAMTNMMLLKGHPSEAGFEQMDVFANLMFEMAKRGDVGELIIDDCYDGFHDVEVMMKFQDELLKFTGTGETVKKKQEAEEVST